VISIVKTFITDVMKTDNWFTEPLRGNAIEHFCIPVLEHFLPRRENRF